MSKKHNIFFVFALLSAVLVLGGCSTKKNTFTRRAYHNLTSHYNVYWNGEYSLQQGEQQLRNTVKDDYSKVLRVYNYGTRQEAMALNATMDRALQKTSICVQKHSMKFSGKERVRWIDDAYLVMAKAHFFKQDYIAAKRTFEFVATEFSYNDISLVAELWLIKTYIETEQYTRAIAAIEMLQVRAANQSKLPKELYRNLDLTVADYYIATKDYSKAINYLKSGMLAVNDRDMRIRCMFILGQIYMELGDATRATEWFGKVIRKNPEYEMLFEAKMNMAQMGSSGNSRDLYRMLDRMLGETKNEEFIDRIYYSMAELAMREGNTTQAIEYYRNSVAYARTNQIQRAASSLKVATILFNQNNYELSQAYYDTAVSAMNRETYPEYDSIANISQTLNDLVLNLSIIRDQDSLLRVANMDSISRNALIDRIIADVIEQERIAQEQQRYEEQLAQMGGAVGTTNTQVNDPNASGNWYFYNPTTLQSGFTEFARKWGMRRLEDNWRISDKRNLNNALSDGGFGSGEEEGSGNDSLAASLTDHDRGYYLIGLPFTEEEQATANKQIAGAMYNVGFIYLDRLSDFTRSIQILEQLDARYPDNDNELPAWYALYKMYNDRGEREKSDVYKSRILSKYPESSYANFILDPSYYIRLRQDEQQASELYSRTYEAYQQGQYYRVRMNAERALELYAADTALAPRFALLDAVARGRLETVDSMAYALVRLINDYPASSIRGYATDLLQIINDEYHLGIQMNGLAEGNGEGREPAVQSPYTYEPTANHFVVIVFNSQRVRVEPLKVRLTDFNQREHRFLNLEMRNLMISDVQMLLSLSPFGNEQEAKDYIASMFINDYLFGGIDPTYYSVVPMSVGNYTIFLQQKNIDEYKTFLQQHSND